MTPAIVQAVEKLQALQVVSGAIDLTPIRSIKAPVVGDTIAHDQVIAISQILRKVGKCQEDSKDSVQYHLDNLLRGSRIFLEPPKPKPEPSSEYKALMTRLHREEEARAYERMINPPLQAGTFAQRFPNSSNTNLFPAAQADVGEDDEILYTDINRQMALIINILISIVACSVAIWLAARHWSTPSRLGLSMGGSGMIGVAEIVVYAGYLRRLKTAREKGKKEVEIKEIVKTWIVGGNEKSENQDRARDVDSKVSTNENVRRRRVVRS